MSHPPRPTDRSGPPISRQPPRRHQPSFAAPDPHDAQAAEGVAGERIEQEFIAGGTMPYRAVTDRHAFAEVHLYPPIRIIGVFNSYSVLMAVGIANGIMINQRVRSRRRQWLTDRHPEPATARLSERPQAVAQTLSSNSKRNMELFKKLVRSVIGLP
jgi:hypothetical protein